MLTTNLQPDQIWRTFRAYTMVKEHRYLTNLALAKQVADIRGAIVECGVWRGGMIAGIAATLGPDRDYRLFDSFEGLPAADLALDGAKAVALTGRCRASEDIAEQAMQLSGATNYTITKGWFTDTLPTAAFPDGIALLRLDGDWYDSTTTCLQHLYPHVNPGGLVLIDDYYYWPGCAQAVHDYLTQHQRLEHVQQAGPSRPRGRCVAYLIKDKS